MCASSASVGLVWCSSRRLRRVTKERYARFADEVQYWDDPAGFISRSDWRPGLHVIGLPDKSCLEVLIRGDLHGHKGSQPVFFNGAVDRDKGKPPYFSGMQLASEVNAPLVAIADPTLAPHNRLRIGWYTGLAGSRAQDAITELLGALSASVSSPLVLTGGSAGGFASLYYAGRTESSAFVWNPQVDLLKYGAAYVRAHLTAVLNDSTWAAEVTENPRETPAIDHALAASQLAASGFEHIVNSTSSISRLLYLQNVTDVHERVHAKPLRERDGFIRLGEGLYQSESAVMAVGEFAASHSAPPRDVIRDGLLAVLDAECDLVSAAGELLLRPQP